MSPLGHTAFMLQNSQVLTSFSLFSYAKHTNPSRNIGVPKEVTDRATEILATLEKPDRGHPPPDDSVGRTNTHNYHNYHNNMKRGTEQIAAQIDNLTNTTDPEEDKAITIQILAELRRCKTKELSPQDALTFVNKLTTLAT